VKQQATSALALAAGLGLAAVIGFFSLEAWFEKMHRTDLHAWVDQEWPNLGIQIQMPATAQEQLYLDTERRSASWSMHYRNIFIADAYHFIKVQVQRRTPAELAEMAPDFSRLPRPRPGELEWYTWATGFEPPVAIRDDGERLREYRRNVRISGEDVVNLYITYTYADFSPEEQRLDEAAIRRILDSARPLAANTSRPIAKSAGL
jgi:hypothetical protein